MNNLRKVIENTKKLKLLYVEDNEDARTSTLAILNEFFDDILVAENGVEGLEKFHENKIDLVITDINMPKMNGLDMLKKIMKIKPGISTIVLSAYNESDLFMDSIKMGVDGYLLKPIDFDQFLSILDKATIKTEVLKSNKLLEQYKEIADASSIMSVIDKDKKITYVNKSFCDITGYTRSEIMGISYTDTLGLLQEKKVYDDVWDTISVKKQIYKNILKYVSKGGKTHYLETTIKPILDVNDDIIEYIALRHDVTAIMNPYRLLSDLVKASKKALVVLMHIEDFEDIEALYGEEQTQKLQDKFKILLEETLPSESGFKQVFMLRNGEYALAKDLEDSPDTIEKTITQLQELQEKTNASKIYVEELDYDISVIMSVAYEQDPLENAKYGIKKLLTTKQSFIISNKLAKEEQKKAQQNIELLKMIKKAIAEEKIISYFQPIVNNKTKQIDKYESLVRLIDDYDRVISPAYFLNISKKGNYYTQLTSIILDNSFGALKKTDKDISINISVLDIQEKPIREKIIFLLKQNKQDSSRVILELLEDEKVENFQEIQEFILEVKALGAKIAIDDFGSGYSNFARLLNFHPDILKIDGSLIKNIDKDELSLSIVRTMVAFAKEQNLQVVAEYVENEQIFNIIHALGVDYSQGYYFGKPEAFKY